MHLERKRKSESCNTDGKTCGLCGQCPCDYLSLPGNFLSVHEEILLFVLRSTVLNHFVEFEIVLALDKCPGVDQACFDVILRHISVLFLLKLSARSIIYMFIVFQL